MELDLRFLLEEQRERKATIREQGMGRPPPSLLLHMTQGEKEGLPALHCTAQHRQQGRGMSRASRKSIRI